MAKREIYHSTTLGPIPLSFTGRHLMQTLREAFTDMLSKAVEKAKRGEVGIGAEWDEVSRARGKIAQYMSKLEERPRYGAECTWRDPEPLEVAARRQEQDTFGLPPRHFGFDCGGRIRPNREETSAEMLQRLGTDADLWAKEFMHKLCDRPTVFNVDDVRAWFANAIEAGAVREAAKVKETTPYVLPPIPKGYELNIVGGIVSIAPIVKVSGKK